MAAKETVTESIISVFQAVLEFVFYGYFRKLIKLILNRLLLFRDPHIKYVGGEGGGFLWWS